jgi:hypothetical protein
MRTFLVILVVLAVLIGAAAVYLVVTTPKAAEPVRFPLSASHRQLLERVPPSADAFALIPSAAQLHAKLLANPVTSQPVLTWTHEHELPRPWMLGGADIAAWRGSSGKTAYAIRLDPVRALLVRIWLLAASNADARWEGSTLIMHDPGVAGAPGSIDDVLRLANGLPEGDVLVVQRTKGRGAFPPIGRPAATSVKVTKQEIVLVSRAGGAEGFSPPNVAGLKPGAPQETAPVRASFPRGALLSATFATPPKILGDVNRLIGTRIDALLDNGGSLALYDLDAGTLLPRPKGVLVLPADADARAQWPDVVRVASLVGETRDLGDRLLVSFDRTSMARYLKDTNVPGTWPANQWAMRFDPRRLVPILRRAGDNAGLRFATPRIHRGVRDLRRWIDALERAESVEAAASTTGGVEELRVRVASK